MAAARTTLAVGYHAVLFDTAASRLQQVGMVHLPITGAAETLPDSALIALATATVIRPAVRASVPNACCVPFLQS